MYKRFNNGLNLNSGKIYFKNKYANKIFVFRNGGKIVIEC